MATGNLLQENYNQDYAKFDVIDYIMGTDLARSGVQSAVLVDMAGNIVSKYDNGNCGYDLQSFAALASANFAAVDSMARIIGERGFSILFQKGKRSSTHFSKINDDLLLIATFEQGVSLGKLRQKLEDATRKIRKVWNQ